MWSDDRLARAALVWGGLAYLCAGAESRIVVVLALLALTAVYVDRCAPSVHQVFRIVTAWIGLVWLSKLHFVGFSYHWPDGVLHELARFETVQFVDPYFVGFLGDPWVVAAGWLALVGTAGTALLLDSRAAYRVFAWACVAVSALTLVHQWGMAVQMAVTTFWVGLWLVWLIDSDRSEGRAAATLGQLVASFIFFGPALGKLTDGYWSGSTITALGHVSPFPFETFHMGRQAILFEGLAALSFLLPPRWASLAMLAVVTGMLTTFGVSLLEPLGPVVGICFATWILVRTVPGGSEAVPVPETKGPMQGIARDAG